MEREVETASRLPFVAFSDVRLSRQMCLISKRSRTITRQKRRAPPSRGVAAEISR